MSGYSCAFDGFLFGVIPFGFNPFAVGYDEAGFKDALIGKPRLSGEIPPELGNLAKLIGLDLGGNQGLSGPLPGSFTGLSALRYLQLDGTQLCAPTDTAFQAWLRGIKDKNGVANCASATSPTAMPRPTTAPPGQFAIIREVAVPVELLVRTEIGVIREVPVQVGSGDIRVVEVIKEVPVEVEVIKVVEVIKEVPVLLEPGVQVVEVIREVPVEVEVIELIEVIKEVPVQVQAESGKVVEVIREVMVPVNVVVIKEVEVIREVRITKEAGGS